MKVINKKKELKEPGEGERHEDEGKAESEREGGMGEIKHKFHLCFHLSPWAVKHLLITTHEIRGGLTLSHSRVPCVQVCLLF